MRAARLLFALCVAFCAATSARADSAGQVMFAYGETHALRDGLIVQLHAGSAVESGDQLHTGVHGYLQVRFTDWSVMTLRPRTDFVIDEFAYEARAGGLERAFFSLIHGGVRSLTGIIGHRDRSHYRLRTRMTSIGIRGTHYSVLVCEQNCRLDDGSLGEDGVYGGVIEGRIAVSPYGGPALEREFAAGEYFRLASANSVPERFVAPPPFFWDPREPQARAGSRSFAGIPWKAAPGAATMAASGDPIGIAGSLLRTDGSLTLSPITAPLLSQPSLPVLGSAGSQLGSTVGSLTAPVTPLLAGLVVSPVVAPVTTTLGSTLGSVVAPVAPVTVSVGAIAAPIAPVLGSTVGAVTAPVAPVIGSVGAVAAPVIAPVAPVVAPVVAPIIAPVTPIVAPVVAPVATVVAPVTPIIAPVAPVVAPVVPAPIVTVAPPPPAVTLPTVPSLPVTSALPTLLKK